MKEEMAVEREIHTLRESILRTVLYYDIFNYPLNVEEVFRFLPSRYTALHAIEKELNALAQSGHLFKFGKFYTPQNNESLVARRLKGNAEAEKYLPLAHKKALLISKFPFVRAVLASGSLSKGFMDENSDIDFFIITEPGRLWISRTLLVLYKRVFLNNNHQHFCVNYFVDSRHVEIEEKNLFTATELATVIPLTGTDLYQKLLLRNDWLKTFYPNFTPRTTESKKMPLQGFKKFLEKIINLFGGNWWEDYCMRLTQKRWNKLYEKQYTQSEFNIAFKTKKYASKNHPRHYQKKIMDLYAEKLKVLNAEQ